MSRGHNQDLTNAANRIALRLAVMLIIVLLAVAMCSMNRAEASDFNPFDTSDINQQRHVGTAFMAYGISMTAYAAGMEPEYAAPLGFVVTVAAEHYQHNGRHGMSRGELQMIAIGAGASYITEKVLQRFGLSSTVRW